MGTPKVCQVCVTEKRGNNTISQRAKKSGTGEYWANSDGSPHFFAHGEGQDGKVKFLHPRNWDEFKLCADGNPDDLANQASYKGPITNPKATKSAEPGNAPDLTPGEADKAGTISETVAMGNSAIKHFRLTAWELAKDLNPNGTNHELRISASGFIHDFMNLYCSIATAKTLATLNNSIDDMVEALKNKG
jgi:hypothetical protein